MFAIGLLCMLECVNQVLAKGYALENKHFKVAAETYKPFFVYYCPDGKEKDWNEECLVKGKETYGGALWDFLVFMQNRMNMTFSISNAPDSEWGTCHETNNCTGMIGMVNRNEVDFALGMYLLQIQYTGIQIN